MRQFQFEYTNKQAFSHEISKLNKWCETHVCANVVFYIYSETPDQDVLGEVCGVIGKEMPYALYMGCSSNGNIVDGVLSPNPIAITCTVYEYSTTKLKMLQYEFKPETRRAVAEELKREISEMGGVKAVEMLMTIRGMSLSEFCDGLASVDENVQIFGGGAFNTDINSDVACVFTNESGFSKAGIAFLLIGGDDFYVTTSYVTGWKPLGRPLRVTKAQSNIIYELDGEPAYDTYYKYLNIKNDENFFFNTLEFPFLYRHNGIDILRAPIASNPDGSLVMTSDLEENVTARIAYGDPWTIIDCIQEESGNIAAFDPELIHIYSCAARRTFWGNHEAANETMPFHRIAPVSGFYTSGEFLRTGGYVNQHNVTLVIAAMREGEPIGSNAGNAVKENHRISGKISMVSRLATFIGAATEELEQANRRLELMAISDGMTKLLNRNAIQGRIEKQLYSGGPFSLVMLDIDNFKSINDTCGHKEGDNVIIALSDLLKQIASEVTDGAAGRWGGEEFMLLLPGHDEKSAENVAERIRKEFADINFELAGHRTVSLGIVKAEENEKIDCLYNRVDSALYEAKKSGKNKTVIK